MEQSQKQIPELLPAEPSASSETDCPQAEHQTNSLPQETRAQRRRRQRLALIEEFGGPEADLKRVAVEAMKRGMYSPSTNRGDVELCLLRTWKLRHREYRR